MAYKDFTALGNVDKTLIIRKDLLALKRAIDVAIGGVSVVANIASAYAKQYSVVKMIQQDATTGNLTDVTPAANLSVPRYEIADARRRVAQLTDDIESSIDAMAAVPGELRVDDTMCSLALTCGMGTVAIAPYNGSTGATYAISLAGNDHVQIDLTNGTTQGAGRIQSIDGCLREYMDDTVTSQEYDSTSFKLAHIYYPDGTTYTIDGVVSQALGEGALAVVEWLPDGTINSAKVIRGSNVKCMIGRKHRSMDVIQGTASTLSPGGGSATAFSGFAINLATDSVVKPDSYTNVSDDLDLYTIPTVIVPDNEVRNFLTNGLPNFQAVLTELDNLLA